MSGRHSREPRQLPLELPHRAEMGREAFLAGAANEAAIALIDRWPDWPERGALVTGPEGSGKSHLVEIWRAKTGGAVVAAANLRPGDADRLIASGAVAVEDLHAGEVDEHALFHLLNLAVEQKAAVLLTSRDRARALAVQLADLASRLRAVQPVELFAPDDDLLRRVLIKLFADRQLTVEPAVIDYVVLRMERSLQAANAIVERLDREALAEGRAVTRQFAGTALAAMFEAQGSFWPEEDW
jgi:chromosomal replication initiation ATPase DnaA